MLLYVKIVKYFYFILIPRMTKKYSLKKKYTKDNIAINDNIEETKKRQLDYLSNSGH